MTLIEEDQTKAINKSILIKSSDLASQHDERSTFIVVNSGRLN